MKTKMGLLSGGHRQAITLLMAVIVTPEILLLDEHTAAHMFADPLCRIMRGRLESGAGIGLRTHEDSCEIVYCFSGSGKAICDGVEEHISAGVCHYCPKGRSHTVINDGTEKMQFLAIVPQQ